jgi:hypothetical protein
MASIALFIFKSLRPPTIRCYRRHSCAPCGKPTIVNMFPTESDTRTARPATCFSLNGTGGNAPTGW